MSPRLAPPHRALNPFNMQPSAWWPDYTFHPFPTLSSSKHADSQAGRVEFTCPLHPNIRNNDVPFRPLLLAAIVKLTSLYVEAPEFVFAEIHGEQPISAFKVTTAVVQQDSVTWADLSSLLHELERRQVPIPRARSALGLADSVNPYPVIIVWDSIAPEPANLDSSAVVVQVKTPNKDSENITVALRWDHSVMSVDAAHIFAKQILSLFDVAAADPSRTASTLELDPLLTSIIEANYDPEEACSATDWLVRNAVERPNAVAHEIYSNLSSPPRLVTYSELNTMVNKLANWLRSNGLNFEDRVALCRSRDLWFYIAHAAIFKSGGCYVSVRISILTPVRII